MLSCSVGYSDPDFLDFNVEGPVYGPNGELELDPDNQQCNTFADGTRPVFATCKNNCPGGELAVMYKLCTNTNR